MSRDERRRQIRAQHHIVLAALGYEWRTSAEIAGDLALGCEVVTDSLLAWRRLGMAERELVGPAGYAWRRPPKATP